MAFSPVCSIFQGNFNDALPAILHYLKVFNITFLKEDLGDCLFSS